MLSSDRLCPSEIFVPGPTQFPPETLFATMVFLMRNVLPAPLSMPPPLLPPELPLMVVLTKVSVPLNAMPRHPGSLTNCPKSCC